MRLSSRFLLAAMVPLAAVIAGACSSPEPAPVAVDPALADVVFEGGATAPAAKALLAATPKADPVRGPTITAPPDQSLLEVDKVTTFTWKPGGMAASLPPSLLPEAPARPSFLRELLPLERSAWAAPTPLAGPGYFLIFSTDKQPSLLRVFTTATSYTPDAAAWAKLTGAGSWTKLLIAAASFEGDRLLPSTGPFTGTPIAFCVESP